MPAALSDDATTPKLEARGSLLQTGEWTIAVLGTCLLIAVHFVAWREAGGLWRDEVNTVNVAGASNFSEFLRLSDHDSYARFWPLVVRGWMLCGMTSDSALRFLGMIVGLLLLATLWWSAWACTRSLPLCALILAGMNPVILHYGDSLRAYGLGTILLILMFGLSWRVVQQPTWRNTLLATVVSVAAVNTIYQNPFFLLAMCLAATAVELRYRNGKRFLKFLTIGLVAAVSLIVFAPRAHIPPNREHLEAVGNSPTLLALLARCSFALNWAGGYMNWVWLGLVGLCVLVVCWLFARPDQTVLGNRRDFSLFFGTTLIGSIVIYFALLNRLPWATDPWHYVALMGLVAVIVDAILQFAFVNRASYHWVRLVGCVALAVVTADHCWDVAHLKFTNIDSVAEQLSSQANKDDLILVNTVWSGIPFHRYYHGRAPWTTIPDIDDHRVHRNDLVADKMAEENSFQPTLDQVRKVLQAGHSVWVVGGFINVGPKSERPHLPAAPHSRYGWSQRAYFLTWSAQLGYLVRKHAQETEAVPTRIDRANSPYETLGVTRVHGWQDTKSGS